MKDIEHALLWLSQHGRYVQLFGATDRELPWQCNVSQVEVPGAGKIDTKSGDFATPSEAIDAAITAVASLKRLPYQEPDD